MQKIDPKKLSLQQRVEKLNEMIFDGHILEAFEKFYAENITRRENNKQAVEGKDACRLIEEYFVTGITAYRKTTLINVIMCDTVSIVEWEFDYTHEELGDKKYVRIVVQQWNNEGQICNEIIYNNN